MTGQQILTIGAIAVALATAGASSCSIKQAREAAETARGEAETLRGRLEDVECENAEMREILARANEAISRATKAVEEAAAEHVERIEKIETVDPDWLMCPLPDELRDMFGDGQD